MSTYHYTGPSGGIRVGIPLEGSFGFSQALGEESAPAHHERQEVLNSILSRVSREGLCTDSLEQSLQGIALGRSYVIPNDIREELQKRASYPSDLITLIERGAHQGDFYISDLRHVHAAVTGEDITQQTVSKLKVEKFRRLHERLQGGQLTADVLEGELRDLRDMPRYRLPQGARSLLDSGRVFHSELSADDMRRGYAHSRKRILVAQGISEGLANQRVAQEVGYLTKLAGNAESLIEKARLHQENVRDDLRHFAALAPRGTELALEGEDNSLKSAESLARKITAKLTQSPEVGFWEHPMLSGEPTDVLRFTVVVEPKSFFRAYVSMLDAMVENGYDVLRVRHIWPERNARYIGTNVILKNHLDQPFELQFHTRESLFGNRITHVFYERLRSLPIGHTDVVALRQTCFDITNGIERPGDADLLQRRPQETEEAMETCGQGALVHSDGEKENI